MTSVSPWLKERAEKSPILERKDHRVVLNGLDTNVFHVYETSELKKKLGLKDEKIIFHATPFFDLNPHHIKGGYYVAEIARRLEQSNVKIIVAGSYSKEISLPKNMIMLGRITDQKLLAKYYSMADVTLLTSQRETFSMITAESLCCGTPVVGFKAGGPENIAINEYSYFLDFGDVDLLKKAILETIENNYDSENISSVACRIYAKLVMCENFIDIYKELYRR